MTATIKSMTPQYIVFDVKSSSRDMHHEILFNRATREWSCTCEDYYYRKRACKHTRQAKKLLSELIFECNTSNKVYTGITLTEQEIQAKEGGISV